MKKIGIESAKSLLSAHMYRARALTEIDTEQAQAAFAEAIDLGEAAGTDAGRTWPRLLGHHAEFLVGLNSREAPEAVAKALEMHRIIFGLSHPATKRLETMAQAIHASN